MNSIESIKIAIGEPLKKKLGGQEFEFYPLEVTELVTFHEVVRHIGGDIEKATKQDLISLTELVIKLVKKAFPQDTSEELVNQFVIKYFYQLQEILLEIHTPNTEELSEPQKAKIEQLKQKVQKNVKPTGENQATSSS